MIRVLVVVDHPLIRIGASTLLRQQEGIEVVGVCEDVDRALSLTEDRRPGIVLLGLPTPDTTVAHTTRQLVGRCPGVRVIVLASHPARLAAQAATEAGAAAYLPNTGSPAELVEMVRTVAAGGTECTP